MSNRGCGEAGFAEFAGEGGFPVGAAGDEVHDAFRVDHNHAIIDGHRRCIVLTVALLQTNLLVWSRRTFTDLKAAKIELLQQRNQV